MQIAAGTTVSDVGEFGLIALLRDALPAETVGGPALRLGIGDDAAIWTPVPGRDLVITTDSLVEDVHFRLDWTDWASLGHKSLAVNLSDLAAMGAEPRFAVITLGLRGNENVSNLLAMYEGLGALAKRAGITIVGGDIVRSPAAVTIHVTAIGDLPDGGGLRRSTAKPGDLIAVSGTLGASAAGLRLLANGLSETDGQPATASVLIAAHLRPEPRLALGRLLSEVGVVTAMDLSDGLLGDLPKILTASGARAEIEVGRLPVPAAVRSLFADDWLELAMRGGEDYELLFCATPEIVTEVVRQAPSIGATVTVIGDVLTPEPGLPLIALRQPDGTLTTVDASAFDHFR
jgi:thiamine-monophosphate kinase